MPDHQQRLFQVAEIDVPSGCGCQVCDGCGGPTDQPVDVDGDLLCNTCAPRSLLDDELAHLRLVRDPRPIHTIDTGGLL